MHNREHKMEGKLIVAMAGESCLFHMHWQSNEAKQPKGRATSLGHDGTRNDTIENVVCYCSDGKV